MGFAPPEDAPSLPAREAASVSISFAPAPTGLSICGFTIPGFNFNLTFRLPGLPKFDFRPLFFFALALKCDLSNPIDADFGFGGGRMGNPPPEDHEYD
jgi:hypothetical protein